MQFCFLLFQPPGAVAMTSWSQRPSCFRDLPISKTLSHTEIIIIKTPGCSAIAGARCSDERFGLFWKYCCHHRQFWGLLCLATPFWDIWLESSNHSLHTRNEAVDVYLRTLRGLFCHFSGSFLCGGCLLCFSFFPSSIFSHFVPSPPDFMSSFLRFANTSAIKFTFGVAALRHPSLLSLQPRSPLFLILLPS